MQFCLMFMCHVKFAGKEIQPGDNWKLNIRKEHHDVLDMMNQAVEYLRTFLVFTEGYKRSVMWVWTH